MHLARPSAWSSRVSAACMHLVFGLSLSCSIDVCNRGDARTVARVVQHQGVLERAQNADDGWARASDGDTLRCEESVRTGAESAADIELLAGGAFHMEADTRVLLSCGDQTRLSVELGDVIIEAGDEDRSLELEIGRVRLSGKGRYRVAQGSFEVLVGQAVLESRGNGEAETLEPGDNLEWEVGAVTVERVVRAGRDAGVEPDAAPADGGLDAGLDAGPGADAIIASLRKRDKRVEARAPDAETWQRLEPAEEHPLAPGTRLRVRRRQRVELIRGTERAVIDGPAEVVVGPGEDRLVEVENGRVQAHTTKQPLAVQVPGGRILLTRGKADAEARIEVEKRGQTRVRALSGNVEVTGANDQSEELVIGERVVLDKKGTLTVYGRAPARADFAIPAGESATIHDPGPPSAVGVRFGDACPEGGIVEVSSRSNFRGEVAVSRGDESANIRAGRGNNYYRVRCYEGGSLSASAARRGRLRVVKDRGTLPLPKRAATSIVDADGRRYRVLYQNRLPAIVFRWPKAPKGKSYRFHLEPKGKKGDARDESTGAPRYEARAGSLAEGTYEYYFESGGKRSKVSTLSIGFDNAAPSAHMRSPGVNDRWSGSSVRVQGVAMTDSEVSVGGVPAALDRQGRFSADVSLAEGQRSLAVKLEHRRHGTHYYVRRSR